MKTVNVQSSEGVTLVGGGMLAPEILGIALDRAPRLVAADGGANACASAGFAPETVIGDFDSLTDATRKALHAAEFIHVTEQDSTDFEKCLTRIDAPFILATGFTQPRLDHTLAVLSAMLRHTHPPVILLGEGDLIFVAPPSLHLNMPAGTRVSLFPMIPVSGTSQGLEWPINDLVLQPSGTIGVSNRSTGPVHMEFDQRGCLILMPPEMLDTVLAALGN